MGENDGGKGTEQAGGSVSDTERTRNALKSLVLFVGRECGGSVESDAHLGAAALDYARACGWLAPAEIRLGDVTVHAYVAPDAQPRGGLSEERARGYSGPSTDEHVSGMPMLARLAELELALREIWTLAVEGERKAVARNDADRFDEIRKDAEAVLK